MSIWKLLELSFEHYQALTDALIDVEVPSNVSPQDPVKIVGAVGRATCPVISFKEGNFP